MLDRQRPFSPGVPAEAGCLFTVAAGVHVFISGESLHCFLVGWCTNKSYVIATSDLWLFIHASNLLPSTPHPHSPTLFFYIKKIMPFSTQLFFWPVLSFLTSCIICFVLALFFPGLGDMCQGDFTRNCKQVLCRLNALGSLHTIVSPMEWSSLKGRGDLLYKDATCLCYSLTLRVSLLTGHVQLLRLFGMLLFDDDDEVLLNVLRCQLTY